MSKFVRTKAVSLMHRADTDGIKEVLINIDYITYIDIDQQDVYFRDGSHIHIASASWDIFISSVNGLTGWKAIIDEMEKYAAHELAPVSFDQSVAIDRCIWIIKQHLKAVQEVEE